MSNNSLFNHFMSILILPFVVLVVIPYVILKYSIEITCHTGHVTFQVLAYIFIVLGLGLMLWTILLFAKQGKGTLAPWNPTVILVINGPYKYVRNPMILGVLLVLLAESFYFNSLTLLIWMILFFFINNIYFEHFEEPELERKFADDYVDYKTNVRRWIPKTRGYSSKKKK